MLSGGRYDNLPRKMGKQVGAIGFALSMGLLEERADGGRFDADVLLTYGPDAELAGLAAFAEALRASGRSVRCERAGGSAQLRCRTELRYRSGMTPGGGGTMINVALPKGRLGERAYEAFASAGYDCPAILEKNRKLTFENLEKGVRYFWVKPSDVSIYVERGAADVGIAGRDILLEYRPDVYELLDLKLGRCRMCVAGPEDFYDDPNKTLRVATKFPHIAGEYYESRSRDIDIIKLNGSIELAPILGLSDVIVDIVETGTTLKENDLGVFADVAQSSARLIANKASYQFSAGVIDGICGKLREKL